MVCIFVRTITDELASLVKQIDDIVGKNESRKMSGFVVVLTDDADSAAKKLRVLAEKRRIERVPLTVFKDATGPPDYAISNDAEVTAMMWSGEKKLVRVNHAFGPGKLGSSLIPKIVADTSKILSVLNDVGATVKLDDEGDVVAAGIFNTRISTDHLKHLATLTKIERVELQDVDLTAAGLKHLQGLTRLRSLNLFRNKRLTDSGVDTLIALTQLEELNISSTGITNVGLERLAVNLPKLTRLNFRNSRQIDDAGLAKLLRRPELEVLLCGNTGITDAGMAHLGKLTSLDQLEVRKTRITNAGLAHLKAVTDLQQLNCSDNKITNEGVQHLSGLTELRSLDLSQTRISDAALAHLKNLTRLEKLDVSKTRIAGEGLRHLHRLRDLRFVNLFGTQATDASTADLQRALPRCEILR